MRGGGIIKKYAKKESTLSDFLQLPTAGHRLLLEFSQMTESLYRQEINCKAQLKNDYNVLVILHVLFKV